ncbi:unnamed protein product [Candida verbasci]|uniref:MATE efflux family protein n=1 Tax=Candida verbasci TaxID=1227364 RepID=A0A9W4TX46_9ASCO|nr:unnamed protein product [Candida verbasci]
MSLEETTPLLSTSHHESNNNKNNDNGNNINNGNNISNINNNNNNNNSNDNNNNNNSRKLSHISEIDEDDIISYVQQRRQSIISIGNDKISRCDFNNNNKNLNKKQSNQTLTSPLHPTSSKNSISNLSVNQVLNLHESELIKEPKTTIKNETKILLKYSFPLIITFLLQYSLTVASVFSVGRLGSSELAAVSLSSMTANISGYAIIQGVSTCLDTLCAQSFGRSQYNLVGIHFQRCNLFLLICYIPIFILWFFLSEPLLIFLIGSDQFDICVLSSKYLQILSFGLPGFILFENAKHFLQCQSIFHASTYVLIICAPLNAFLNYVLVWNKTIGLGFIGAPLSVVITNWIMCILLYCYIFLINGYQCWPKESILNKIFWINWNKMLNLSIPCVLMVEAEWLAFEIITFQAAKFGTTTLAAQSIISTTCVIFYQIPFALSIASSTRIAWFIGAASKKSAKITTYSSLYTSLVFGILNCTFLYIFKNNLASLYTKNKDVIKLASKVLTVGAVYQINDFISCSTGGILRGQGRQWIGGILNLIGYYLIALPLAYILAFLYDLQLLGLWFGMIFALIFVSLLQLYFVLSSNWDKIIDECIEEGIIEDGLNIDAHSLLPSMSNSIIV